MRVCFLDLSTQLETVDDLDQRARGGMVTSLFKVTEYLAKHMDVTALTDIKVPGIRRGVRWARRAEGKYDVLVCNRGAGDGHPSINAKHRILWTHDLPHNGFVPKPRVLRGFDCTVFMSRYAERIWRTFYRDIGRSVFIPNGVDESIFRPGEKDYKTLIFCSAPNRGLERLPFLFDAINTRVPCKLVAYSNLLKLHPNEVRKGHEGELDNIYSEVRESGVDLRDPVRQPELASELSKAGLMVLPSSYPEICSNVVLQSLFSGTPVVTTGNLGATCEWVKHGKNGLLTDFQPHDYMVYQVEMVRNVVRILEDEKLHKKLIKGASDTKIFTWDQIGAQWKKLLERYSTWDAVFKRSSVVLT